jgi:hypothetical protein
MVVVLVLVGRNSAPRAETFPLTLLLRGVTQGSPGKESSAGLDMEEDLEVLQVRLVKDEGGWRLVAG